MKTIELKDLFKKIEENKKRNFKAIEEFTKSLDLKNSKRFRKRNPTEKKILEKFKRK